MPLDFRALWANHRKELLIGGGAAAAGLGLYTARKGRGSTGDGSDSASSGATAGVAQAANTAAGADGTYDSTPNDVYSAIQPQLEQTQSLLGQLLQTVQNIPSSIQVTGSTTASTPGRVKKKPRKGRGRTPKAKPRGGTPHHATPRPKGHPHKANHPKAHPTRGHATLGKSQVARSAGLKVATPGGRVAGGVRATAIPKAGGHVAVRLDRPNKVAIPTRAALAPRPAPAPAKKAAPAPRRKR